MRNNAKLKSEKRQDRERNQSKMIVTGRSVFNILRIKLGK